MEGRTNLEQNPWKEESRTQGKKSKPRADTMERREQNTWKKEQI